jgi:hypothetical protein
MGKSLGGLVGAGRERERAFVGGGFHGGRRRSHAREGGRAVPFIDGEQHVGGIFLLFGPFGEFWGKNFTNTSLLERFQKWTPSSAL